MYAILELKKAKDSMDDSHRTLEEQCHRLKLENDELRHQLDESATQISTLQNTTTNDKNIPSINGGGSGPGAALGSSAIDCTDEDGGYRG